MNLNIIFKKDKERANSSKPVTSTMAGCGCKVQQRQKRERFLPLSFNSPYSLKSEQPLRYQFRRYPRAVVVHPPPPVVVPPRVPIE